MAANGAMMSNLGKFFTRPKTQYENHTGETITVNPSPNDLVYLRSCSGCVFTVTDKCAKCIMESCQNVQISLDPIMSGTLELIKCDNVSITIRPQDSLPSISADRCSNLHLNLNSPKGIGFIHSTRSSDVFVHMQPPFMTEQKLDLPEPGSENWSEEYISRCSDGKMFTVNGIRVGGGYLSTEKEEEEAQERAKELEYRLGEYLDRIITIHPKGQKPTPSTDTKTDLKVTADKKVKKNEKTSLKQEDSEKTEGDESLADALKKQKESLKPTETVVTNIPTVGLTNIQDEAGKREYFDTPQELQRKVEQVAKWIRESSHAIVFTGAGISTSAGIPDFRSGMKTVLPTGPGVWELRAQGAVRESKHVVPVLNALPTPTHMAIVKLHETGKVKFTVSQNIDGLHRRSGLGPDSLSELHGNTNLETCGTCMRQYLRDFETREARGVFNHTTSRKCDDPACRGTLYDSIVNFCESLPKAELRKAYEHAHKADLCIVLGSSLRVLPACVVPEIVSNSNNGRVVICNLQQIPRFPADDRTMPVYCLCDDFMLRLMKEMDIEVPKFLLKRRIKVTITRNLDSSQQVVVRGVDTDEDMPYSFLQSAFLHDGQDVWSSASDDPFVFSLPAGVQSATLLLEFHGHYREPPHSVVIELDNASSYYLNLEYDVTTGKWNTTKSI